MTIKAARGAQPVEAIQRACAARMGFLRGLKTWGSFGKGWSRRVAAIEAAGVRMAIEARGVSAREALADVRDGVKRIEGWIMGQKE